MDLSIDLSVGCRLAAAARKSELDQGDRAKAQALLYEVMTHFTVRHR